MQKITPFLMYSEGTATDVATYYQTVFGMENVEIIKDESYKYRYMPSIPEGGIEVVVISLFGTRLSLMSAAGMNAQFNDAVSFVIYCEDQVEIDRLWDALVEDGGEESSAGWCHDKYGVRWQILPQNFTSLLTTAAAIETMMMGMKIDIAALEAANKITEQSDFN